MKVLCFLIHKDSSVDEAWEEIETQGLSPLYSQESHEENGEENGAGESEGKKEIIVSLSQNFPDIKHFSKVTKITLIDLEEINWEDQWEIHGKDFQEGKLILDLSKYAIAGKSKIVHNDLKLIPGPGFGDLSHPTTRLVLKLMSNLCYKKMVLDIGVGSGVLSLAALGFGASFVFGIDIDPLAIIHAQKNASLNHFENQVQFSLNADLHFKNTPPSLLILMNMIRKEQEEALQSINQLIEKIPGECVISGIQKEEEKKYLKLTETWGWTLIEKLHEENWLGMKFIRSK